MRPLPCTATSTRSPAIVAWCGAGPDCGAAEHPAGRRVDPDKRGAAVVANPEPSEPEDEVVRLVSGNQSRPRPTRPG
jgi:hypothetical protein